ncbi:hypothetical protein TWF694_001386 [Orbilia ellipsospora]|uniref:Uncharacterized protein n=1 Tax=Orbilia ellipsospora TaxID=2528407 RepID=A0AAV9XRH9_9PEZI
MWTATSDSDCPKEWKLGCQHGSVGQICYDPSPSNPGCCACRDKRPKNMSKTARVRSYCNTCETHWKITPDYQCPREWKLLEPRHDCRHSLALDCEKSPVGEVWCCACKDGAKYIKLQDRLRRYCGQCRSFWNQAIGRGAKVPLTWGLDMADITAIKITKPPIPPKPQTSYPDEDPNTHRRMFDEGPRYGPPRYGRDEPDRIMGGSGGFNGKSWATSNLDKDFYNNVKITASQKKGPESDYSGYEDVGPQRDQPKLTVPTTAATSIPRKSVPLRMPVSRKEVEVPLPTEKAPETRNSSAPTPRALSTSEKRREKEREGLCVGRAPKFLVPPDVSS